MLNRFPKRVIIVFMVGVFCLAGVIVRSAQVEPEEDASAAKTKTRTTIVQETDPGQSYVGSDACFPCHRPQGAVWSETKHSKAFEILPEKYRDDSSCLECHVTAHGEPGGYSPDMAAEAAKPFLSVGCETCHGPGAAHVAGVELWMTAEPADEERLLKEMRAAVVKTPTDSHCAACHQNQSHKVHPTYDGQPVRSPSFHGSKQETTSAAASQSPSPNSYSVKTCGSCHYEQYTTWRVDKHVGLSTGLPAKYENDESCLKCHRKTGKLSDWYTAKTDSKAGDTNKLGVGCESCHGSASEHVLYNKQFIGGPVLTPELREATRELMRKENHGSACLECHVRDAHKEHPKYEQPNAANTK